MVCANGHPTHRTIVIVVLTLFLLVLFQAWYDVYINGLTAVLGQPPTEKQLFWSTLGLTLAFFFIVKVGLNTELYEIFSAQGFS